MPPKVTITKLQTARQTLESISKGETDSAVFSDKTDKNTKEKKSSPKSKGETESTLFSAPTAKNTKGIKKNSSNELRMTISFNIINPDICLDHHKEKPKNINYG